jgi:2-C-methyl-D-erythritol 4-phosphate cytidylyltransferase
MNLTAIVLAAGRGTRFKKNPPKPLFRIAAKPILIYSLLNLSRHPGIKDIIVVTNSLNQKKIIAEIKKYRIDKIRAVVLGGLRRQDSVAKGLAAIDNHTDFVLIHDAARPFINAKIISSVIKAAKEYGAAISGVRVRHTIKQAKKINNNTGSVAFVEKTLDRKNLWEIQTPQVFKKSLIIEAYRKFGRLNVTDDASLVEKLKKRVSIVFGSYLNIKITAPEDIIVASEVLKNGALPD